MSKNKRTILTVKWRRWWEGGQKWQTREVFTKWQVFGEEWVIWTRQKFHACICSHRQLTCEITIWVILYMEKVNCLFLICTEVDDQFRWFVWSLGAFDKSCCLRQTFLVRIQIKQDRWNHAGENLPDGTFVRFVFRGKERSWREVYLSPSSQSAYGIYWKVLSFKIRFPTCLSEE